MIEIMQFSRESSESTHVVSDMASGSKTNQLLGHSFASECNSDVQRGISILCVREKQQSINLNDLHLIKKLHTQWELHTPFFHELSLVNFK